MILNKNPEGPTGGFQDQYFLFFVHPRRRMGQRIPRRAAIQRTGDLSWLVIVRRVTDQALLPKALEKKATIFLKKRINSSQKESLPLGEESSWTAAARSPCA